MKTLLTFCVACLFSISSEFSLAWDHPQKVRLGGNIIGPGTSKLELLQSAGKPLMIDETGYNLKTGKREEVWYYKKGNKNVMIIISGSKVRKVEYD